MMTNPTATKPSKAVALARRSRARFSCRRKAHRAAIAHHQVRAQRVDTMTLDHVAAR